MDWCSCSNDFYNLHYNFNLSVHLMHCQAPEYCQLIDDLNSEVYLLEIQLMTLYLKMLHQGGLESLIPHKERECKDV